MSKFKVGQRVRSIVDGCYIDLDEEFIVLGVYKDRISHHDRDGAIRNRSSNLYEDAGPSTHYAKDATGSDFLDRFFATNSPEAVRGAMSFVIGKYVDRLGKKDGESIPKELGKIIDYAERYRTWLEREA